MLPKQAISFEQLQLEISKKEILKMCSSLKLFPTPFRGVYYVPLEEERKGEFIENPRKVLHQSIGIFLGGHDFYFSCRTAEENLGIGWRPSGSIHVVNTVLSRKINLANRINLNKEKKTWRAKKIAKILSFYGNEIIFHKGQISGAKIKETPYGKFARKSQIIRDRKRFKERAT